MSKRSRKTFQQLVTLPDSAIPLAEVALLMACEEYPQLEISPYLDKLDHMAQMAQESFDDEAVNDFMDSPPEHIIASFKNAIEHFRAHPIPSTDLD